MKKYPPLKLKLTVFLTQISLVTVVVLLAAALFFVSIIEKLSAEDELRTALKQIEIKIANATETLLVEEHTLTQMSLTKANALELLLKYNISAATSQEELDKVRAVLQTEEINIIDTSGRIINASPPTSIGSDGKIYVYRDYNMYDGEQSAAFMTLLDTKADYHAQPPQPNSFAGKDMQYLAVPFYGDDGEISLILQVGNSSDQYDKSLQAMNPEKLFSDVIIRKTGYVVVLDKDTNEVIYPPVADTRVRESKWQGGFDTDDTLGFFAENVIYESKIVGNVRVIAVLPAKEAYAERPELLGLLFATFAAFFIVITFALNRFLHRRLIQPLSGIIVSMNNLLDIGKVASASETDVFEIKSLNENIKRLKEEVNIRIETLEELGFQDTLTEIPNRLSLNYRAASEFGRVKREKFPISVIMIDIDNFKVFNDTYGHPAGDKLLREVAQTVSKTLKRAADFAARYGGEEFCVLLPNTSLKGAETVAELIRRNVDTNEFFPDGDKATISLGVATYDPSQSALEHTSYEIKFEQLLEKADKALYFAKKAGKNRVCLWEF